MNSSEVQRAHTKRWPVITIAIAAVVMLAAGAAYAAGAASRHHARSDAHMASRAQQVMPFDLNRTTHNFTKTADGGVQTVVAKDAADTNDVGLIRSHLEQESKLFRAGDYSDPARIHGMDMPGVKVLEQGFSHVQVAYSDVSGGGRITYTASEPALVSALHDWFDRQTSDHSMPGMGG